jgi:hypothetical protein
MNSIYKIIQEAIKNSKQEIINDMQVGFPPSTQVLDQLKVIIQDSKLTDYNNTSMDAYFMSPNNFSEQSKRNNTIIKENRDIIKKYHAFTVPIFCDENQWVEKWVGMNDENMRVLTEIICLANDGIIGAWNEQIKKFKDKLVKVENSKDEARRAARKDKKEKKIKLKIERRVEISRLLKKYQSEFPNLKLSDIANNIYNNPTEMEILNKLTYKNKLAKSTIYDDLKRVSKELQKKIG